MTSYARKFDENAPMYFTDLKKFEKLMRIDFESKTVYGDDEKYIKTKIKIYVGSMITSFHNKKNMPKEKVPCKFLSIIMLDSLIKANEKYYLQTFLQEWKYLQEKIKTENLMTTI